jgi:hypothetical protein
MEFSEDVLSVIRAFARPLRPKEREAKLIKEHVKETRDKVVQKLERMARADPFQDQRFYKNLILRVDTWTHYGRVKVAKQPPGWLREPLPPAHKYDTPIYLTLYRASLI